MPIFAALVLTAFYVGLSLALGGTGLKSGFPWWFIAPAAVSAAASLIAVTISAKLPIPGNGGRPPGPPPRRVRLSWRAAVRLPVMGPVILIPWHMLSILRLHFNLDSAMKIIAAGVGLTLVLIARRRRREFRLLRDGLTATARIDNHQTAEGWTNRLFYHFRAMDGTEISSRAWDSGYGDLTGADIPVYYDPANPRDHIIACAGWFEAE